MASDQEWKLDAGTAWILPAGDGGIVKPLVLASKAGPGRPTWPRSGPASAPAPARSVMRWAPADTT